MRSLASSRGMTLLEVMIALFVFALAGTAVMKAASSHLNSISEIEDITFATWVASNRLNQLKLNDTWPPKNDQKGTMDMSERTWYWRQKVEKTNDDTLRQVEIIVGLDELYTDSVTSVKTFVTKPAQRGGNDG
ncbi:type II secretion system minor pseudopilin GspI [Salinimonas sp. HHU 13199]|uniref:Type II secretion system protein I n=1 Tax=Salinimonas profundi TaxID=2729140 RepID=A0ABR8LHF8_9ALTE|nr:type II secretion system minor pseudopilin GspI [Salinimonas profundi]MBD3585674.1 type II secretion system minor pseudopilin GspI [Salinimonas profundi]